MNRLLQAGFLFLVLGTVAVPAAEPVQVLTDDIISSPAEMMTVWLNEQTAKAFQAWEERYETLKTPEQIAEYQKKLRQEFVDRLGGFPERTPLNAKITGVVQRDGYRVEKVLFESQPQHYVTALCFVPESKEFQAPYPATLIVCGHSANGKGQDGYQTACALLAKNGILGMIIDPISQGERSQHVDAEGKITVPSSTEGHTLIGLGSILLGQNTARFEIWDGMRAIDYLQSRKDVKPELIGCMGNSGGGTQTAYLMALEDRIAAASPSCYITTFKELLEKLGPQDAEQIIFGQLQCGIDHADYLLMRAPLPINLCAATQDFFPIEGVWDSYRKAKRIYTRLGFPERVGLAEVDEKHGWHQPLRESATQWMVRWLDGRDIVVREPEVQLLSEAEYTVTPTGQVQQLEGARSTFDLNIAEYERLAPQRKKLWENPSAALEQVQQITGISRWAELKSPEAKKTGESQAGSVTVEQWVLMPEPGIYLPALLYLPETASEKGKKRWVVYLNEAGKQAAFSADGQEQSALTLAEQGACVLAVDLRGLGETSPQNGRWYNPRFGNAGKHAAISYLLGHHYLTQRTNDLLAVLKWLQTEKKVPTEDQLELIAVGETGPIALHAACLSEESVDLTSVYNSLLDWKQVVVSPVSQNQMVNCVHGALRAYDLSDLSNSLGQRVKVINPLTASNQPVDSEKHDHAH